MKQENKKEATKDINHLDEPDLAELYKIATNYDIGSSKRFAAVENITDIDVLIELSDYSDYYEICNKKFNKVIEQIDLVKIAKGENPSFNKKAFKKITDLELIKDIALDDSVICYIRYEALKKLSDQKLTAKVALEAEDFFTREQAVSLLTDEEVLFQVVIKNHNETSWAEHNAVLRTDIIKKMKDKELLTRIINGGDDLICRWIIPGEQYMTFQPPDVEKSLDLREVAQERLDKVSGI